MAQWASAFYAGAGLLVVVERYERWIDEAKALERWNVLVERAITQYGEPTSAARERAMGWGLVPSNAIYWSAHALAGAWLVLAYTRPMPPTNAHLVEVVGFDDRAKIAPLIPQ